MTDLSAETIVPRLKHMNFLEAVAQVGVTGEDVPVVTPFVGDLLISYAFELEHSFLTVSKGHCEKLDLTEAELPRLAISNLGQSLPPPEMHPLRGLKSARPACSMFTVGNQCEACLMLFPGVWEAAARMVKGQLVVATPARDTVLFTGSRSAAGLAAMKHYLEECYSGAGNHALSKLLFAWANGWSVYDSSASR